MGFLNPLWLLLGAAVAVPLILHLLQRHQGPRVIFPAMRYLRRAEREHARRIKLRQLLLLLLRVAALILVALAAARPFLRSGGSGHEPTAVVIILDNSMSSGLVSGDRRVLDELKDRALETIARAGPDDRFWLLRAGAPWEPALPGDALMTASRIRSTQPTAASADIVASVERARSILEQGAGGRAREIQVLSDLQLGNLRGQSKANDDKTEIIVWTPKRPAVGNTAIAAIEVGGGLAPRARERSNVVVEIAGDSTRDSVNLRLHLNSRTLGAAVGKPGDAVVIPFPPQPASLAWGWVELDADALRADDRRHFVVTITPPPRVLLTSASKFIADALQVLNDAGRIVAATSEADILIAPAAFRTDGAGTTRGVAIIPPESELELPAINRRLSALGINWQYQNVGNSGEARFATNGRDELERALANARVLQFFRLVPTGRTPGDSVLLRLQDGTPWAVSGERARGGRFVLLASPLTPEASTLPTSVAMIPLMDRLTGLWTAASAPRSEARPGEQVNLPAGASLVITPAGDRDTVVAGEPYYAGTQPGAYQVVRGGSVVAAYVVNPPAVESVLRYADRDRIARALPDWDPEFANDAGAWTGHVFQRRLGFEMWRLLLLALLLLLIAEAVAAATGSVHTATVSTQET